MRSQAFRGAPLRYDPLKEPHRAVANPAKVLQGADSGVTAAFELVATPALFALFGYFLDRWLGTGPLFAFLLAGIVVVYEVWKLWFNYSARMQALEAALPNARGNSG